MVLQNYTFPFLREREEKTIELTFGVQPEFHKEKLITLNDIQKLCQENKRFFQEMQ